MIAVRTPGLGVGYLGRLPEQYCAWVDLCLRGGFQPTWRELRPLKALLVPREDVRPAFTQIVTVTRLAPFMWRLGSPMCNTASSFYGCVTLHGSVRETTGASMKPLVPSKIKPSWRELHNVDTKWRRSFPVSTH